MGVSIITDDCLTRNKVRHYVLNSCITSRYHFIDIKIEKSPFPIKFIHRPSNKYRPSSLKYSLITSIYSLIDKFLPLSPTLSY